ncbi:MAG: hypothetical protein U0401_26105 [Anaerolineae bacterium]
MNLLKRFASYVPALITRRLAKNSTPITTPSLKLSPPPFFLPIFPALPP